MTTPALVLFDIDGTLMKPGDREHARALLDAFRVTFDLEPDLEGVQLAGMLDAQITRQLLAKHGIDHNGVLEKIQQVMHMMGELYSAAIGQQSLVDRRLPGAVESVAALESVGFHIGTLTGNARRVAEVKLGAAELGHLTRIGGFGDQVVERGMLVEKAIAGLRLVTGATVRPEQVVLIGDTPQDIFAAHASRAQIVTVATGRYDEAQLRAAGADHVLTDLTDPDRLLSAVYDVAGQQLDRSRSERSGT
ncbi:MAG: HAD family hydrolase [Chloroflexota bacterium]